VKTIHYSSLFARMLGGFTIVMLCIWGSVLAWNTYETKTEHKYKTEQDAKATALQLLAISQAMPDQPERIGGIISKINEAKLAFFRENNFYAPTVHIQIFRHGVLIYESSEKAPFKLGPPTTADVSRPITTQGLWAGWESSDATSGINVRVVHEVVGRYMVTIASMTYYLLPLIFSAPLMLIPLFFSIFMGLRPLQNIVTQLGKRSASDLSPLPPSPYRELSPLVTSVNGLMKRLLDRLEREKEFLADAAHEMKTPLAVIQINAATLLKGGDKQTLEEAAHGLNQGVARATHTVHQMLALARFDSARVEAPGPDTDLVELVRGRLAAAVNVAMARGIELEFSSPERCMLPLHRESMISLIDNLIDNAVKYSPADSRVTASIATHEKHASLTITDQGPGIPKHLRTKVFERFYRMPDQEQEGSGLGLAIAEKAAAMNRANIRLEAGPHGSGLAVTVDFHVPADQEVA
jgi:two-component system sensor histidine kinase QseC